jgi:hypothetical protein
MNLSSLNSNINQINNNFNKELLNLTQRGRLISEKDGTLKSVSFISAFFEDLKGFFGLDSKTTHIKENISNYIVNHADDIQGEETIQLILKLAEKGGLIVPNPKNISKFPSMKLCK